MTIRQATLDDINSVQAIVHEVVQEMMAEGNTQWDDSYPDASRFVHDIENGTLYVAENIGEVLGFVAVDQDEPTGYQGLPWSDNRAALVIHRFAISSQSRSLGIASLLESFICRSAQKRGISHIKVDTYLTNAGMQAFLAKKGYRKVGEMEFLGKEHPFFCYEKSI